MSIHLENISFGYGQTNVLQHVSLAIPDGRFVVLLGKNGSGKSTLLKILTGILPYKEGKVSIDGHELKRLPLAERARMIGFLPQHFRMVFSFSVEDFIMTGRASRVAFWPGKRDRHAVLQAMERTGTLNMRKRPFTELSGGEQQLVRIARILSQEPKRILLDEPTTHLDLCNQAKVMNLLKELAESGIGVVAVLHDPNAAFVFGDTFVFLRQGHAYEIDGGQNPWDEQVLRQVYDMPLECVPYRGRALVAPVATDFQWKQ